MSNPEPKSSNKKDLPQPVEHEVPTDEQHDKDEPITEHLEREEERSAVETEGYDLEENLQQLDQPKTGWERGDGPDVKRKRRPNLDYTRMPESGEGPIQA